MTPLAGRGLVALLALALAIVGGCRDDAPTEPLASPEGAALELFALAGPDEPPAERVTALFGGDLDPSGRAALGDALQAMEPGSPRVLAVESLGGDERVVVDVEVDLAEHGLAEYTVHLERAGAGPWRVVWFAGPGVDWPEHSKGRGPGLTTSHEAGLSSP